MLDVIFFLFFIVADESEKSFAFLPFSPDRRFGCISVILRRDTPATLIYLEDIFLILFSSFANFSSCSVIFSPRSSLFGFKSADVLSLVIWWIALCCLCTMTIFCGEERKKTLIELISSLMSMENDQAAASRTERKMMKNRQILRRGQTTKLSSERTHFIQQFHTRRSNLIPFFYKVNFSKAKCHPKQSRRNEMKLGIGIRRCFFLLFKITTTNPVGCWLCDYATNKTKKKHPSIDNT